MQATSCDDILKFYEEVINSNRKLSEQYVAKEQETMFKRQKETKNNKAKKPKN